MGWGCETQVASVCVVLGGQAWDGDVKPKWLQCAWFLVGKRGSVEVNWKALA